MSDEDRPRSGRKTRGYSATVLLDYNEDELVESYRPPSTGRSRNRDKESKTSPRQDRESKYNGGESKTPRSARGSRKECLVQHDLDAYRRSGTPPASARRDTTEGKTSDREARRERRRATRGGDYKGMSPPGRTASPRGRRNRDGSRDFGSRDFDASETPRSRDESVDSRSSRSSRRSKHRGDDSPRSRSASRERRRGSRTVVQKRARDVTAAQREEEYERNRQEELERKKEQHTGASGGPRGHAQVIGDMELNDFENFQAYVRELVLEKGFSNRREIMVDCVDFVGRKLKAYESEFIADFLKKHNNKAWGGNGPRKQTGDSDSDDDEIYMIPSLKSEYMDRERDTDSQSSEDGEGRRRRDPESKLTDGEEESKHGQEGGSDNNKLDPRRSKPENMVELAQCLHEDKVTRREFLYGPLPRKLGQLQAYVEKVNNDKYLFFIDEANEGDPKHPEARTPVLIATKRRGFNKALTYLIEDFGPGSPNEPDAMANANGKKGGVVDEAAVEAAAKRKAELAARIANAKDDEIIYDDAEFPYVGKLRADFGKGNFVMFDNGANPRDLKGERANERPRCELMQMGFKRQMTIGRSPKSIELILPAIDEDTEGPGRDPELLVCRPMNKTDGLKRWARELPDCVTTLVNKNPEYNKELKKYLLSFGGRITKASVKNFQLIEKTGPSSTSSEITLQFGRRQANNIFALDFQYPLTPVQAFGIALSISLN